MLSHILRATKPSKPIQIISSVFSESVTNVTSFVITKPSSVQTGDLLLVVFSTTQITAGARCTPPAGWTEVLDDIGKEVAWKIATSSEPSTYTFTYYMASAFSAFAVCIRNAAFDIVGTIGANATPNVAPAITVTANSSTLFCYNSSGTTASVTWSTPTGFSSLIADSNASIPSAALFSKANVSSGTTGDISSIPSTGNGRGFLFSVKPN